jgi:hypothetical protein
MLEPPETVDGPETLHPNVVSKNKCEGREHVRELN